MSTKVKWESFWILAEIIQPLQVAKDIETQGPQWGGFMCTLVTRTTMRDGGELGSSSLLAWVTPVPGECSSFWADKVTLRKLRICLFLDKFRPLSWEVVHTRPQRLRGQRFHWNEGSACGRWTLVNSCLLCVLTTTLPWFPREKIPLCLLKPPLFPLKGLGICLPFHLTCRE